MTATNSSTHISNTQGDPFQTGVVPQVLLTHILVTPNGMEKDVSNMEGGVRISNQLKDTAWSFKNFIKVLVHHVIWEMVTLLLSQGHLPI